MSRKLKNWLDSFCSLAKGTESPDCYWLWSGIFTLTATLQRRCYLDMGLAGKIYPHLYVLFVSKPGKARKGAPVGLAGRCLEAVEINIASDSSSKEALLKQLCSVTQHASQGEVLKTQSALSVVGDELSAIVAVDAKKMIDFLITIYDLQRDKYTYDTISRDRETIEGPSLSLLAATTPTSLADNVPFNSFGDGFFARCILVAGVDKRCRVALPVMTEEHYKLQRKLYADLQRIKMISGAFEFHPEAFELYREWYEGGGIDGMFSIVNSERFHTIIDRMHIQVIKTAMALHVAHSDTLMIEKYDIAKAIDIVSALFENIDYIFEGFGRNRVIADYKNIIHQLSTKKRMMFSELLKTNIKNLESEEQLKIIVNSLCTMGNVEKGYITESGDFEIKWRGI